MAGTLSELRAGLKTRLETIDGLRVATQIPEQINPPVAVITRQRVDYHQAMAGGLTEWSMQVQLIAGRMADQHSQRLIDDWLSWDSTKSIRKAIEGDRTLDGAAETCKVVSADALTSVQVGDAEYLGVTVDIVVYA